MNFRLSRIVFQTRVLQQQTPPCAQLLSLIEDVAGGGKRWSFRLLIYMLT